MLKFAGRLTQLTRSHLVHFASSFPALTAGQRRTTKCGASSSLVPYRLKFAGRLAQVARSHFVHFASSFRGTL